MTEHERLNDHEKFKELGAIASSGTLRTSEWAELKGHLQVCEACREVSNQYLILASEGIPLLAARYGNQEGQGSWDDMPTRRNLFARVQAAEQQASSGPTSQVPAGVQLNLPRRIPVNPLAIAVLAACLVVAVGLAAYHLGIRAQVRVRQAQAYAENYFQNLATEKKQSVDELLDTQTKKLSQSQEDASQREQELTKLRPALRKVEDRANELAAANRATDEQLRRALEQRDSLSGQLRDAEQAYQTVQA